MYNLGYSIDMYPFIMVSKIYKKYIKNIIKDENK